MECVNDDRVEEDNEAAHALVGMSDERPSSPTPLFDARVDKKIQDIADKFISPPSNATDRYKRWQLVVLKQMRDDVRCGILRASLNKPLICRLRRTLSRRSNDFKAARHHMQWANGRSDLIAVQIMEQSCDVLYQAHSCARLPPAERGCLLS